MSSPDPRSNRVHDPADELEQLMADLEALVDARLVVEIASSVSHPGTD